MKFNDPAMIKSPLLIPLICKSQKLNVIRTFKVISTVLYINTIEINIELGIPKKIKFKRRILRWKVWKLQYFRQHN